MVDHRQRSALLWGLLTLLWPAACWGVDLDDALYRNLELGVKLEVPDGWTLHRQTGFPSLLLLLSRKESNATISLAAAELPAKTSMKRFLADNGAGLRAIGLRLKSTKPATLGGRPAWIVDAQTQSGAVVLRQINLPRSDHVFVLTLSCPAKEAAQLAFELSRLLEVLDLSPPQRRDTRELQPSPADGLQRPTLEGSPPPGLEGSPPPGLETEPLPAEPGPGSRPGVNSRPSGDDGRTVDSRPNRPGKPSSRPASRPAQNAPPSEDLPPIEGQEL